ncbi:MAG TPA: cell wall hydrolase [Paracoccaceae bacterium]|nr:cell wall hydrolase [Paracoccaceae bacterium]
MRPARSLPRAALAAGLLVASAPPAAAGGPGFAGLVAMAAGERMVLAQATPRSAARTLATTPAVPVSEVDLECLAKAVYFEARGEPEAGKVAVAEVVLNRVAHPDYPDSVCGVVEDAGGGGCQFSWTCDGLSDRPRNAGLFERLRDLSARVASGEAQVVTDGATHFHTVAIRPGWSRRLERTATIGAHHFYRLP